jgi:hypothetical protein
MDREDRTLGIFGVLLAKIYMDVGKPEVSASGLHAPRPRKAPIARTRKGRGR